MDTITHALSGALVGRAAALRGRGAVTTRDCVVLGCAAAAFPDADVVLSLASPLAYLYHHRGATHSIVLLPLWGLLLAWIAARLRGNRAALPVYFLIASLAIGTHILGDLITSFGTMLLAPVADTRFELGTTFIIDLWFTGIILAALIAAGLARRSRLPAVVGLAVLCGYVVFQWTQKQRAIEFGAAYAAAQGSSLARVNALPRPVSPFNWMVIVTEPDRYHYAFVNLRRTETPAIAEDAGFVARLDGHYLPLGEARWQQLPRFGGETGRAIAMEAWSHERFGFYRWFAAFPFVSMVEPGNPSTCVWFRDLRFMTPGRNTWPFEYAMCRGAGTQWAAYERGDDGRPVKVSGD